MEHTPPAFFNRGPAPVVRLTFFALLSLALITYVPQIALWLPHLLMRQ